MCSSSAARLFALILLLPLGAAAAQETRFKHSLELSAQAWGYAQKPAYARQANDGLSAAIQPELDYQWRRGGSLRFVPFARWDQRDDERTHADIRELLLRSRQNAFDLQLGIARVFWGVTESAHLVDIINQTDLVEDPDGEDKLGQPLASLGYSGGYGRFEVFLLPYFRERRLSGAHGRLRAPLPYDRGEAVYESSRRQAHVDGAARWSISRGKLDLGLSYFNGTSRDPRFTLGQNADGAVLIPNYDLIEQTGLDVNYVHEGWIFKLEAIHRHSQAQTYSAAVGGFEYTFATTFADGWEAGVLLEGLWDERGERGPSFLQNDVFVGLRLSGNDVAGSELLAGAIVDLDHRGMLASVEASRRIGAATKLALELRSFSADAPDPLSYLRRDDYLMLELTRYF